MNIGDKVFIDKSFVLWHLTAEAKEMYRKPSGELDAAYELDMEVIHALHANPMLTGEIVGVHYRGSTDENYKVLFFNGITFNIETASLRLAKYVNLPEYGLKRVR